MTGVVVEVIKDQACLPSVSIRGEDGEVYLMDLRMGDHRLNWRLLREGETVEFDRPEPVHIALRVRRPI